LKFPCRTFSRETLEGMQMGILGWILFGLIVGALAKLVMPGRDPGGFIVTMLAKMNIVNQCTHCGRAPLDRRYVATKLWAATIDAIGTIGSK